MKNIENNRRKYLEFFSQKYYGKSYEQINQKDKSTLIPLAEMWALSVSIIPDDFSRYSIFDFNGYCKGQDGQTVLTPSSTNRAKELISYFCYGESWANISKLNVENSRSVLDDKNKMSKRFSAGNNVVIYGDEDVKGKTMIASIIMKEAIRLRATQLIYDNDYEWIDFSNLIEILKRDDVEASSVKGCDWLVVDDICSDTRSLLQTVYFKDLLNSFFYERYYSKLPTILVFKYDVYKNLTEVENDLGSSAVKLLTSKRTCKIKLEARKDHNNER